MPYPPAALEVLDREFLTVRARLLEIAAALDRLDRAGGLAADDSRLSGIREALGLLLERRSDRAEQIQLLFSLPYDNGWRQQFGLERGEAAT